MSVTDWLLILKHLLERVQVSIEVVVVTEDGEGDEAETVLELVFFKHLLEELGHLARWVAEGTTAEGTKHEAIVAMLEADAINRTYLIASDSLSYFGHMTVVRETDFKLAPQIEGCIGDDSNLEGMLHKGVVGPSLAKNGDSRRIDSAEIEWLGKGIVVALTVRIVKLLGIASIEGEDGACQCAASADGLLLGTSTGDDTATRVTGAGEVEQGRVVTLTDETLSSLQAVVQLHHNGGAAVYLGRFNAR